MTLAWLALGASFDVRRWTGMDRSASPIPRIPAANRTQRRKNCSSCCCWMMASDASGDAGEGQAHALAQRPFL
jgi:hypothetical protein